MLGGTEIFLLAFVVIGVFLLPLIFYLVMLNKTFNLISPQNRTMEGSQVWLMFVPFFNLGWQFVIVNRLSDSLKKEFGSRNLPINEAEPGKTIGITYCILRCCSIVPFLGILASIGGLVCWIIHWAKIAEYKRLLETYSTSFYMNKP